jgi:hypothetical protein
MDLILKIKRDEIKGQDKEKTVYNHIVWELKRSYYSITHIIERYNDVDDAPSYQLGYYKEDRFVSVACFQWGEPLEDIMENKLDALTLEFDCDSVHKLLSI